jgi:hypothetical protein
MSTTYAIANVQHSLQALKELIPPDKLSSTPLPVIAAPGWWMSDLCTEMGVDDGFEPESIHGCAVIRSNDVTEPWLIDHDGRRYPILPKWQRAKSIAVDSSEGDEGAAS